MGLAATTKGHKSKFWPTNKTKYVGNSMPLIARSMWERKFMIWADLNPNVLEWASESVVVLYESPIDGERHRYIPDFVLKVRDAKGGTRIIMVEVKPYKQTIPPRAKRKTKRLLLEQAIYETNDAKWKAAQAFCEARGWEFRIMTEYDLGLRK